MPTKTVRLGLTRPTFDHVELPAQLQADVPNLFSHRDVRVDYSHESILTLREAVGGNVIPPERTHGLTVSLSGLASLPDPAMRHLAGLPNLPGLELAALLVLGGQVEAVVEDEKVTVRRV